MNRRFHHIAFAYVLCCLMISAANGQLRSLDPYQRDSVPSCCQNSGCGVLWTGHDANGRAMPPRDSEIDSV